MMFDENALHWFPMRVRHASLKRLETIMSRLDGQEGIEGSYAPTTFIRLNRTKMDFAPVLLNYVFVRSTFSKLVEVKSNQEYFGHLREDALAHFEDFRVGGHFQGRRDAFFGIHIKCH